MKKLKTFEQQCVAINNRLPVKMGERRKLHIFRQVDDTGVVYRRYNNGRLVCYCSECGGRVEVITAKECPHCHAKWHGKPKPDERTRKCRYYMELEAKGDIQLCRIYFVEYRTWLYRKSDKRVREVERIMYAPNGERKVFARGVQGLSPYYDAWLTNPAITLKREPKNMSWSAAMRYNLMVWAYEIKSLTRQWQYKDIAKLMNDHQYDTGALRLIAYPWGETMLKTGQQELFNHLMGYKQLPSKELIQAVNICNRHHYVIDDPSLWCDTMKYLKRFGLDTHNPKYICPKDLRALHNQLLERQRRIDERIRQERREQRRQERMLNDKKYAEMIQHWQEHMGKILSLNLTGTNISIKPLQSINEFKQEGDAMHHCVYDNEYYNYDKFPSSLILSAKDGEGHRLATIEYDTKHMSIVQCRAVLNKVPERDKEIRTLINTHKADFQRLLAA